MDTPFLFNGQWGVATDSNGLLNMRARYYSPYLMRFINADPIGFSGGLNWFAFASGNPVSASDPSGNVSWGLPSQLNQDQAFTEGYWRGAATAVDVTSLFRAGESVSLGA